MCSKLPTEFIIRYIADYNPNLQSRNAIIQKRKNQKQQFYAIIQPMMAKEAENEVTVLLCDQTYSSTSDILSTVICLKIYRSKIYPSMIF